MNFTSVLLHLIHCLIFQDILIRQIVSAVIVFCKTNIPSILLLRIVFKCLDAIEAIIAYNNFGPTRFDVQSFRN